MVSRRLAAWLVGVSLGLGPRVAHAQGDDAYSPDQERRVAVGGDIGVFIAPPDPRTYLNYTNYDEDALRTARLQLFGEWHTASTLSFVGEVRTEGTSGIRAAALYMRWRPAPVAGLQIQIGRIPPVIGAFARHAYGRDNLVLGLPLGYQYLTSLRPDALPTSVSSLLAMRGRGWQPTYPAGSNTVRPGVPLVSSSTWDTGAEADWTHHGLELAGAVTLGSPADPVVRDTNRDLMWSGRAAATLPAGVTVGVSAARAGWIDDDVLALTASGRATPHTQTFLGADTEFGVGRWLVRAEYLHSGFDVPFVGDPNPVPRLVAQSAFIEGRVRIHPRVQVAVRADRLAFSSVLDPSTNTWTSWDADVTRLEATIGVRLSRNLEARGGWQQNWRQTSKPLERGIPVAGLLYWF